MKRIFQIASTLLLFTSCQPSFEDPELKDQVELLENRVVRLEEQLRTLATTIHASSSGNENREEIITPRNTPPTPSTPKQPRVSTPRSSDYSENRRSSSQRGSSSYTSSRCQATTRKGNQCKRMTRSGSYCWQHGG
jgi:hypothetical protein